MRADQTTVVLIEDQRSQQVVLTAAFESRGHRVHAAASGAEALQIVGAVTPDLIVLDLGLPDIDGLVLFHHLRARVDCPIIVVTADSDERRLVEALDLGADDYVTKPFSMAVLLARARVALRHRALAAAVVTDEVVTAGDVQLDLAGRQVMIAGALTEFHSRQFDLLAILARNQGKVLTYSALARALGSGDHGGDERNPWRVSISKIRKQLGTGPRRPVITTEHKVGYRLTVPD